MFSFLSFLLKGLCQRKASPELGACQNVQSRDILKNSKLPHILAAFQWAILILTLAFNLYFTVSVTGAVANGGHKVITLFSVWMLFFSGILCLIFYRIRKGVAEKGILFLSIFTMFFSGAHISLHFVNDLLIIMKATEVIAWTCYNGIFFVSLYQVLRGFLFPVIIGDEETEQGKIRNEKRVQA